jgi:uncharacterized protein (UPF0128 family)
MSESVLKKEFTQKDVQRLRNIYNKQFGAATVTQVGYTIKTEERKEGDIWEEQGKQWTIKNGIKQSYSRIQSLRKELAIPMVCPECSNKMKDSLDKKMYTIHKKCFSCVQAFETKLKLEGKYEAYVKEITTGNARTFLKDARNVVESISDKPAEYFTGEGQKEEWVGGVGTSLLKEKLTQELDELEQKIEEQL